MEKTLFLNLNVNDFGYVCPEIFNEKVRLALQARPTGGALLTGRPGVGKTFLTETVAKALGAQYIFFQCTPGMREDEFFAQIVPEPAQPSGFTLEPGVLAKAALASQNEKVVLTLDEFDKTRPTADALLLAFLQSGCVRFAGRNLYANLDNLIVFMTSNDQRELSDALTRRMPVLEIEPMPAETVAQILGREFGNSNIGLAMCFYELSLDGQFPRIITLQELRQFLSATCEREDLLDAAINMFIAKTPNERSALHTLLREYAAKEKEDKREQTKQFYERELLRLAAERALGAFGLSTPLLSEEDAAYKCGCVYTHNSLYKDALYNMFCVLYSDDELLRLISLSDEGHFHGPFDFENFCIREGKYLIPKKPVMFSKFVENMKHVPFLEISGSLLLQATGLPQKYWKEFISILSEYNYDLTYISRTEFRLSKAAPGHAIRICESETEIVLKSFDEETPNSVIFLNDAFRMFLEGHADLLDTEEYLSVRGKTPGGQIEISLRLLGEGSDQPAAKAGYFYLGNDSRRYVIRTSFEGDVEKFLVETPFFFSSRSQRGEAVRKGSFISTAGEYDYFHRQNVYFTMLKKIEDLKRKYIID